jgi:hypothetical protein
MENETDRPRGNSPPRNGDIPSPPSSDEIVERSERLADYEVAWRALAPLIRTTDAHAGRVVARELSDRIEALADQIRSARFWPEEASHVAADSDTLRFEIDRLDRDLDGYAMRLCDHVATASPDRLHGYYCREDPSVRAGVAALVDFVLDDDPTLEACGTVFEILVTLLSTGNQGGRRCIVRDPATLTKRLSDFSNLIAETSVADDSGIEQEFLDAARACESGCSDEFLRQMRDRKRELGRGILAPQVLRSVVFFNTASWIGASDIDAPGADGTERLESRGESYEAHAHAVATEHPASAVGGPSRDPSTSAAQRLEPVPDAAVASGVQWKLDPMPPSQGPATRVDPGRSTSQLSRSIAVLTAVGAILVLGTQTWWSDVEGTVQHLSDAELQSISPQIASGYRSERGAGSLFIGTVGTAWGHLEPAERSRSVDEILSGLDESGLREILLYDDSRRIALHFAEGLPLRVGP